VAGTKIFLDGVEQKFVRRAVLDIMAGSTARLTLETFVSTSFEGSVEVQRVHVCAECMAVLKEKLKGPESSSGVATEAAYADITGVCDTWKRQEPLAYRREREREE
jgi:hypothetical protein